MEDKCGTCAFWEMPNGDGEGKFGTCLLITNHLSGWKPAPNARVSVDFDPSDPVPVANLQTTEEFGCSEWQPIS